MDRRKTEGALPELTRRRLEDFLAALAKKYGDLTGKIEVTPDPGIPLAEIGGLQSAKREIEGLTFSLTSPHLHTKWGTRPARGVLLYGPPGTGKSLLAKALAHESQAFFFHVRLSTLMTKWPMETAEILPEIFAALRGNGRLVLYFEELETLSVERSPLPQEARAVGRRLTALLGEGLDGLPADTLAVASTSYPDAVDPLLIEPGRFDRLIEIPLPETEEKREIFRLHKDRAEKRAGHSLFHPLDYDALLARMVRMSGADISTIITRALEEKVRLEGVGETADLVSTEDILKVIEDYRRTKEVIEKIRYGQYL